MGVIYGQNILFSVILLYRVIIQQSEGNSAIRGRESAHYCFVMVFRADGGGGRLRFALQQVTEREEGCEEMVNITLHKDRQGSWSLIHCIR